MSPAAVGIVSCRNCHSSTTRGGRHLNGTRFCISNRRAPSESRTHSARPRAHPPHQRVGVSDCQRGARDRRVRALLSRRELAHCPPKASASNELHTLIELCNFQPSRVQNKGLHDECFKQRSAQLRPSELELKDGSRKALVTAAGLLGCECKLCHSGPLSPAAEHRRDLQTPDRDPRPQSRRGLAGQV